jgi:dGTPase
MDFADDVAYSVHDVEDGVVAGRIELTDLADAGLRREVWATARDWYAPELEVGDFEAALDRLTSIPAWPAAPYDGSRRSLGGLKNVTSRLINRFCLAVQSAADEAGLLGRLRRYGGGLVVPVETRHEILVLKGIAARLVMNAEGRVELMAEQRALLTDLVEGLWKAGPVALEPMFRADFEASCDDASRLRVLVDQVASLTDPSAVQKHRIVVEGRA